MILDVFRIYFYIELVNELNFNHITIFIFINIFLSIVAKQQALSINTQKKMMHSIFTLYTISTHSALTEVFSCSVNYFFLYQ